MVYLCTVFSFMMEVTLQREKAPFYLMANENMAAFNAGMHRLDIQRLEANQY